MTSTRKLYSIPVTWKMYADILVRATSLEEAVDLALELDLPTGEYLSDSYEVDYEAIEQIKEEVKEIVERIR